MALLTISCIAVGLVREFSREKYAVPPLAASGVVKLTIPDVFPALVLLRVTLGPAYPFPGVPNVARPSPSKPKIFELDDSPIANIG
jgi:hypothetical protein